MTSEQRESNPATRSSDLGGAEVGSEKADIGFTSIFSMGPIEKMKLWKT